MNSCCCKKMLNVYFNKSLKINLCTVYINSFVKYNKLTDNSEIDMWLLVYVPNKF